MEATVRRLLSAIGEPLVGVLVAPAGLDVAVTGLAIVDPDDQPDDYAGRLVLVIGARGRSAERAVRGVGRRGAVAVAVKTGPGAATELRAACTDAGVALLAVRDEARWEHVEQLARGVIEEGADAGGAPSGDGDLFALAQTIGLLTNGLVIIEDAASRVLAYSRSDAAATDELRRLSILGWQGPPDYLKVLRDWGVFDRVRAGEEVVHIDEHAELGIRARLAVGIHAGQRWLGTIWVQQGATPFAERAESTLVGAARVAAGHLIRRRSQRSPGTRWSHDLVVGLLDGRVSPELAADTFGLDADRSAVVAAFAVRSAPGGAHAFGVAELADIVSVHAATYRRGALTATDGVHVYAVLPGVPLDRVEPGLRAMCAEVASMTLRRTGVRVHAGIGSAVARLAGVPGSRTEADRVLAAMGPHLEVAALGDLRAEILLDGTLALLADAPDLRDPAVALLVRYDADHGSELAASVAAYLDEMGDVRAAAARLTVHPNTLRYRLRRAADVAGLDLDDPRARLVHHLQLLLALRANPAARSTRQGEGRVAVHANEPPIAASS